MRFQSQQQRRKLVVRNVLKFNDKVTRVMLLYLALMSSVDFDLVKSH